MTAQRSAIPPGHVAEQPRWQAAWAQRENDRRGRAYEAELASWHRREEQLERLRIEAAGFIGATQPRTGLPVELDADEVVYRIVPAARLVEAEARHLPGLPAPGLAVGAAPVDASGPALPRWLRVLDTGMAVVTDRRVAFAGRTARREWAFRDLVGPGHHPDVPVTLLHAADGRRPAGLAVPGTAAVNFRFYLTLAYAAATGQRAAIASQLDALLAAHQAARPLPPAPVAPQDAPAALLGPERVAVAAAVAVAVALAGLPAGPGQEPADLPHRAAPGAGRIAAPADGPGGEVGPAPSPSVLPGEPGGRPVPSPAAASVALTTSASPEPSPPARRTTAVPSRPAAPAKGVTTPPRGTRPAPTPTAPAPAPPTPQPSTAPTTAAPSSSPSVVDVQICLDPLRLPLVDDLLCGRTTG